MAFTFSHAIITQATPEALWQLYADPSTWPSWDPDAEYVTLDGPFATGSGGTMKFTGQDPLTYVLEDVDPHRAFTDVTSVNGATIRFGHRIEPTDEGTRLTHEVRHASARRGRALASCSGAPRWRGSGRCGPRWLRTA